MSPFVSLVVFGAAAGAGIAVTSKVVDFGLTSAQSLGFSMFNKFGSKEEADKDEVIEIASQEEDNG